MKDSLDEAASHDPTAPSDISRPVLTPSEAARARASAAALRRRSKSQQWREEFPYHWNADDYVTRRDTLRFLVAGTGALFVATAALGAVGALAQTNTFPATRVAALGEIGVNEVRVFDYPDQYAQGIVVNLPGKGLVGYSDVCTHLSCAVLYQPETRQFHCPCHEGYFDAYTGNVLAGPPSRPLPLIQLQVRGGYVYAVRQVQR